MPFLESRVYLVLMFAVGCVGFLAAHQVGMTAGVSGVSKAVFGFAAHKVGWVAIPLLITLFFLLKISFRNLQARGNGHSLSRGEMLNLIKIESTATKLGLLGTTIGIITAMTMDFTGMSEFMAQAAQMNAFGTALWTTVIGLVLSLIADLQIEEDSI